MKRYLAGSLLLLISLNAAATEEDMLILSKPVSAEKQQSMTPKQALMRLKEGNQRFLSNRMQQRDFLVPG